MRPVTPFLMSLMSLVFALSLAGQSHAASPQSLIETHDTEMTLQHEMMKEDLGAIQSALTDLQEAVDKLPNGDLAPPCGGGDPRATVCGG